MKAFLHSQANLRLGKLRMQAEPESNILKNRQQKRIGPLGDHAYFRVSFSLLGFYRNHLNKIRGILDLIGNPFQILNQVIPDKKPGRRQIGG